MAPSKGMTEAERTMWWERMWASAGSKWGSASMGRLLGLSGPVSVRMSWACTVPMLWARCEAGRGSYCETHGLFSLYFAFLYLHWELAGSGTPSLGSTALFISFPM